MKNEIITVWITKYALTSGIEVVDAELCSDTNANMVIYEEGFGRNAVHGKDWHRTPEAAIARAEEMRAKKIGTLKKSLAKIERIKFIAPLR